VAQGSLQAGVAAITSRERRLGKKPWDVDRELSDRLCKLVAKSTSQPALSDARGAANGQIVMGIDPFVSEQLDEESTIKAAFAL